MSAHASELHNRSTDVRETSRAVASLAWSGQGANTVSGLETEKSCVEQCGDSFLKSHHWEAEAGWW